MARSIYRALETQDYQERFQTRYQNYVGFNLLAFPRPILSPFTEIPFILNLDRYLSEKNPAYNSHSLSFSAYGCLGFKNRFHAQVANSIVQDDSIDFNLELGDNIYPNGPTNDGTHNLSNFFDNILDSDKKPKLTFACLGNHDYNYHGHHADFVNGPDIALRSVNHTYNTENTSFQMPYRYYGLSSERIFIYVLDSNTLPWDRRQQEWIISVNDFLNNNHFSGTRIIAMHHPLQTFGKRIIKHDSQLYFPPAYLHGSDLLLQYQLGDFKSKNLPPLAELLKKFLYDGGIIFNYLICAHDHYSDIYRLDNGAIQVTATPDWPDRGGRTALHLHYTHSPESALIKLVLGYEERVRRALGRKLCYPIFGFFNTPDRRREFSFIFHDTTTNNKIRFEEELYADAQRRHIALQLHELLTGKLVPLEGLYHGPGKKIPKTLEAMQHLTYSLRPSPTPDINLIQILEERRTILPSIGKQLTGPLTFFMRWTHVDLHKRQAPVNGFYYYLPHIFKSLWRRHQFGLARLDENSLTFAQAKRLFEGPRTSEISKLFDFPGYGGTPDPIDENEEE